MTALETAVTWRFRLFRAGIVLEMSCDNEKVAFSHAAQLGGVTNVQVDRFVAAKAAIQVTGPPAKRDVLKPFISHFLRWLRDPSDPAERELRRQILLMVTEGRQGTGAIERDAPKLVELAHDLMSGIG